MKIGVAIFAYNRSRHLKKVLDGLKENEEIKKVYVFLDGLKCEADREEWCKTREVIDEIDWCETKVFEAKVNKGLADSIVSGIDIVLSENDAVVVLEDDCVPQPAFMSFMKQCFEKYRNNQRVYSISGYSWPIDIKQGESDIYFCGRPCPWGWGTWKDRWNQYKRDYNVIFDIKNNKEASERMAIWGDDLERMLITNIQGITNSWYVFWSLLLIAKNGYAVNPYKSLIQNEGFDGSGVHCGQTDRFNVLNVDSRSRSQRFNLPDCINIEKQTKQKFLDLYGSHAITFARSEKEDILVYGVGQCYKKYAKRINAKYNVISFVDKYKKDRFYAGIDIIHPKCIAEKEYEFILVMIEDDKICDSVKQELIVTYGLNADKIICKRDV